MKIENQEDALTNYDTDENELLDLNNHISKDIIKLKKLDI